MTIAGQHFGTNTPTLTLTPTFSSTITSHNDSQIVASISVSGGTPTESVKVSVTSNGYNGNSFTCGTGCQSSPTGSSSANTSALAAIAPRILLNGTDVTGSTQTVVVGERIALVASVPSPQSSNISSQLWSTPPGTAVGGYSASVTTGSITSLPTNASGSYAFYWVAPGSAYQMTYHYTLTNGNMSPNATVTFNVVGPSSITITPSGEKLNIVNSTNPADQFLDWGILLKGAATPPSGYSGSYSWFQIVKSVNTTDKSVDGDSLTCTNGPGFDAGGTLQFPYASGLNAEDGASDPLDSTTQTEASETASFQTFLMWNANIGSGASASIPIALAVLPWNIFGDVVWNSSTKKWVNKSGNGATTNTPFSTYPPLPTWSAAITPTTEKCN
jgi:hypothetical protein